MIYTVENFLLLTCIILENVNVISGTCQKLNYRYLWNARDEVEQLARFKKPIKFYYATMCYTSECDTEEKCRSVVSEMQDNHITKKGLPDIAYNFLIDRSGCTYEGTGWYTRTIQYEKEFLSICFIGINNYTQVSQKIKEGLDKIINFGKQIGYLAQDVKPLFNINSTVNAIAERLLLKHTNFIDTFMQELNDDDENDETHLKIIKTRPLIDWSKIFSRGGNVSEVDKIVSEKKTIADQIDWSKIYKNRAQVVAMDWSTVIKNNLIHEINWEKLFRNNHTDTANFTSLVLSHQYRINKRLGHNNNW